jgi:hypothetical protein
MRLLLKHRKIFLGDSGKPSFKPLGHLARKYEFVGFKLFSLDDKFMRYSPT